LRVIIKRNAGYLQVVGIGGNEELQEFCGVKAGVIGLDALENIVAADADKEERFRGEVTGPSGSHF
jgi:hypothetical protein